MKISKIEFENFRNFRDHGEIICSTDGKVTIVYGKNGDGKTTLHQLFQWIIYGQINFNKTTTERLYNLDFESKCEFNETFDVMGCIEFEHEGKKYSLKRIQTYRKQLNDSAKIKEDFSLQLMTDDYDWKRVERPKEVMEKLLPSGLSDYFFFDGESMIADLRVKGKDSAGKLRKALYSMFDLDVIESALVHIGRKDLSTTALGKLYYKKVNSNSGHQIVQAKANFANVQKKLSSTKETLSKYRNRKSFLLKSINSISEKIGAYKSKEEYERQRKQLKVNRDTLLRNVEQQEFLFGETMYDMFPKLLMSKAVNDAKEKIHLKAEENKLPSGLCKELIDYLVSNSTTECICGNPLCEENKKHIKDFLKIMPPENYTQMYQNFNLKTKLWGKDYDIERLELFIKVALDNNEEAHNCDKEIKVLDDEEKNNSEFEDMIVQRREAETELDEIEGKINELELEKKKCEVVLKKAMEDIDRLTKEDKLAQIVTHKINLLEAVKEHFEEKLKNASQSYSKKLQVNIQDLIDQMLTSKRKVTVSQQFSVRVVDSFNDESKSEGQFAVVSFAYIGGILKLLMTEKGLETKEYPLVLDGPFSKLDSDQRQNVVNIIPQFAPQVILFSKDDLQDIFKENQVGRVWTIKSNEEKNIATVEEGYLWNEK